MVTFIWRYPHPDRNVCKVNTDKWLVSKNHWSPCVEGSLYVVAGLCYVCLDEVMLNLNGICSLPSLYWRQFQIVKVENPTYWAIWTSFLRGVTFIKRWHHAQLNALPRCVRGSPLTTFPMSINNISPRLKEIPQYCYNDVHHNVRTLLLQTFQLPFSNCQCPSRWLKQFFAISYNFPKEQMCFKCTRLNHVQNVNVAKHPYFRDYHISRSNQQHYRDKNR